MDFPLETNRLLGYLHDYGNPHIPHIIFIHDVKIVYSLLPEVGLGIFSKPQVNTFETFGFRNSFVF